MDTQPLSAIKINTKNSRIFPSELGALRHGCHAGAWPPTESEARSETYGDGHSPDEPVSGDTVAVTAAPGNFERVPARVLAGRSPLPPKLVARPGARLWPEPCIAGPCCGKAPPACRAKARNDHAAAMPCLKQAPADRELHLGRHVPAWLGASLGRLACWPIRVRWRLSARYARSSSA